MGSSSCVTSRVVTVVSVMIFPVDEGYVFFPPSYVRRIGEDDSIAPEDSASHTARPDGDETSEDESNMTVSLLSASSHNGRCFTKGTLSASL